MDASEITRLANEFVDRHQLKAATAIDLKAALFVLMAVTYNAGCTDGAERTRRGEDLGRIGEHEEIP